MDPASMVGSGWTDVDWSQVLAWMASQGLTVTSVDRTTGVITLDLWARSH